MGAADGGDEGKGPRTKRGGFRSIDLDAPELLSAVQAAIEDGGCLLVEGVKSDLDPALDPVLLCTRPISKVCLGSAGEGRG